VPGCRKLHTAIKLDVGIDCRALTRSIGSQ
jgi:hypothetical protein